MSGDTTPLQERIRRARSVPADWAKLREGESTREQIERHQERMDEQTAALIAAEVRKAQADALRGAARYFAGGLHCADMRATPEETVRELRRRATDIEKEN